MIVTNVGAGCGGRGSVVARFCAWTNGDVADGKVVWSWRPVAGVKPAEQFAGDGVNKPVTGESTE